MIYFSFQANHILELALHLKKMIINLKMDALKMHWECLQIPWEQAEHRGRPVSGDHGVRIHRKQARCWASQRVNKQGSCNFRGSISASTSQEKEVPPPGSRQMQIAACHHCHSIHNDVPTSNWHAQEIYFWEGKCRGTIHLQVYGYWLPLLYSTVCSMLYPHPSQAPGCVY